jgi:rhamnulokinase
MPGSHTFVAVDLGAASGRVMVGRFDGERLSLREAHRFPNNWMKRATSQALFRSG